MTTRRLVLQLPATPLSYQNVLRTVSYINNATIPNVRSVTLLLSNGINTANTTVLVNVIPSMRKKREYQVPVIEETAPLVGVRHKRDSEAAPKDSGQLAPLINQWPTVASAALLLMVLLSVIAVWSTVRRQHPPGLRMVEPPGLRMVEA